MTVSIRYAPTPSDVPYSLPEFAGTLSPGDVSSVINTYISHDGTTKIENCSIYIQPYAAGVYLGANTPQDDFDRIIAWGDASFPVDPNTGGGLYLNQNHVGGFPNSDWVVFRTGVGDSLGAAIPLSVNSINVGAAVAGEIDALGEAHLRWRLQIPATATNTGIGYIDTIMYYSTTS